MVVDTAKCGAAAAQSAVMPPGVGLRAQRAAVAAGLGICARAAKLLMKLGDTTLVWSVGTSLFIYLLTAIQGVVLARLLGPAARGEYGTAVFYTQTFTFIGMLGTPLAIARRAARVSGGLAPLGRAALAVGALTGTATMLLVGLLAFVALPAEKAYLAPLCCLAALFLPCEQMRLTLLAIDHGSGRFTRYNTYRLLAAVSYPSLLVGAWLMGVNSLVPIVILSIAAPLAPLGARLATEPYCITGPLAPRPRTLIKEGSPYALALMTSDLLNRFDVYLILWLASFSVQGYYAAAVPAVGLLIIAPNTMALFAFNIAARHERPLQISSLATVGGAVIAFQLMCALSFAAVLSPLVKFVYGPAFGGTVPFAMALLPAFAVNGCALVGEGYLQGRGLASVGTRSRLFGAVVMSIFVVVFWGTWRELSIPFGAIAGQTTNALCISVVLLREAFANRAAATRFAPSED